MVENKQLWDSALNEIELGVSRANFSTWFKNTCIINQEDGVVSLGVPNAFVKDWLYNKYHKVILKSLRGILPKCAQFGVCGVKRTNKNKGGCGACCF